MNKLCITTNKALNESIAKIQITSDETNKESWYKTKLPKPPIPNLEKTFECYLQYAQVIAECNSESYDINEVNKAVNQFFPVAEKLQNEIQLISDSTENWINTFWLSEMYLKQRIPLPINFNPAYVFPKQHFIDENDQLDFAAWVVFGKEITREINTSRMNSYLCMDQYDRILNSYREANFDIDLQHNRLINSSYCNNLNNEHIIVMYENQTFVVFTKINSKLLTQSEIFQQLQRVINFALNRESSIVTPIGAATVGNRNDSAQFWSIMKQASINVTSLNWVKSATFFLCLDKDVVTQQLEVETKKDLIIKLKNDGLNILHGFGSLNKGLNRWFDATIQLIVSHSGYNGLCIEHSVAEGVAIINMTENVLRFVYEKRKDSKLHITKNQLVFPQPKSLSWVFNEEALNLLQKEIYEFDQLVKDLQLDLLFFNYFGKEIIKSLKVSPDGFVQLSMQLAHYRLHGYLVSTYESATLRKFQFGRVDNIRAATPETLKWVKAMCEPLESFENRLLLFQKAAKKQSLITQENINGYGIDNHLCALEVLAKNFKKNGLLNEIPEIFKQKAWSEVMRFPLSTSQVTTSPEFNNCYLFYGPVVHDGYGCAYNIQKESMIFAISSFRINARTNGEKFRAELKRSLNDLRNLLLK